MWRKEIVFVLIILSLWIRFVSCPSVLVGDENYCNEVFKTDTHFRPIFKWTKYCDVSLFPGDYVLLYPLKNIDNIDVKRMPRVLFCIVGFLFLYLVCKRYFQTIVGYIVTFLISCFNIVLIHYSFELRPYSVLPVLAIISLWSAHKITEKHSLINKVFISTFYILTAFYHPYSILIIFLPLVFVFLAKRRINTSKWLLGALLTAFIVWVYYTVGSTVVWRGVVKYDAFQYIPSALDTPFLFFRFLGGSLLGNKFLAPLLLGFLALFSRGKSNQWGFLLTLIILPLMLVFLGSLLNNYWFLQRQFVWVIPYFAILVGWLWDTWARKIRRLR